MPLSVECRECGAQYNVPDRLAGKRAKCKKCGATMSIPSLEGEAGDDDGLSALMELAAESGESTASRAGRARQGAGRGAIDPPAGWTPESVIIEKEPNPAPTAAFGSGRWKRNSGGLARLVKPLLLLCIVGGLAYGGWSLYQRGTTPGGLIASAKDKLTSGKKDAEKKPDPPPPPTEAQLKRDESADDLKTIYVAVTSYVGRNSGNWPPDLGTLRQDGTLAEDALKSPFGPAFATGDYLYRPYIAEASASSDVVLAHDAAELANREGANVLFGDGTVTWMEKAGVQSVLQRSDEQRAAAAKQREDQVAQARLLEQQREERERQLREEQARARAELDPNYRPAGRRDVAERVQAGGGGLVKDVQDIAMRRGTEQLIRPATPGSAYAVIVRSQQGDTVEVFDAKATEPVAVAQFQADQQFRANPGAYALSPDGKLIVRLVSWPNLKAVVHALDTKAGVQSIDLDDKFGEPTVVGFLTPDRFVIRWHKSGNHGVEVWNAKGGNRGRQIDLFGVQPYPAPGSEAIAPDGRTYAILDRNVDRNERSTGGRSQPRGRTIGQAQGKLQIVLYDLVAGGTPRRFQVPGLDNAPGVQAAGLAFSPDKTRLAGLFVDPQGRALVMTWSMNNGKVTAEHVVPEKLDPPRAGAGRGRALDWVAGGRGLLVSGRTILDADTGAVLATLDAGKVLGQAITNDSTVHLGYGDVSQLQGVAVVLLDESKFPTKSTGASPGRALAPPQR